MKLLYSLALKIYFVLVYAASFFNKKASFWINGRKKWRLNLSKSAKSLHNPIWFHCASLGEFEQGRPLIEAIKNQNPNQKIILTFFSPSGYEIRKNYDQADLVAYLPLDSSNNARDFLEIINPKMAIFVKYEFWYYYSKELYSKNIPLFLVSAIFREQQHFFKWYGKWWLNLLKKYNCIFVQNTHSAFLLKNAGLTNYLVAGDTRFDRVLHIAKNKKSIKEIEKFKQNKKLLVAGSTWPEDEGLMVQLIKKTDANWKFIIAPHQVGKKQIDDIVFELGDITNICLSQLNNVDNFTQKVLIIDNIGLLSSVYQYADIAYVGGGFGSGIHNTLEAAVYGIPVLFGKNYQKFNEAIDLIDLKAAFSIDNADKLIQVFSNLENNVSLYQNAVSASAKYVHSKTGATKMILDSLRTQYS